MGQTLKVCSGAGTDNKKSKTLGKLAKIDLKGFKGTRDGAPKFIYCQHPSTLPDPVLSYWGNE